MNDDTDTSTTHEPELRRLFQQMRASDSHEAPPFPDELAPLDNITRVNSSGRGALKITGLLAAAVIVAVFVMPTTPAPDDLYLEVMSANTMITDQLLLTSPGTLPELDELPTFYDHSEFTDTVRQFN